MVAKDHELAQRDYILGMSYRAIAEKYNKSIDTVKSWKVRYKWERDKPVRSQKKTAHTAHKTKKVCKSVQKEEPPIELSEQERLFCYNYLRGQNATQAYLLSGYQCNKAAARVGACRMLQRPHVRDEIERLKKEFTGRLDFDHMRLLEVCAAIAFADIGDFVKFGAAGVILQDSEYLDTSVISEVKEGKDGVTIKLADKKWAIEILMKHFDALPDKWQRKMDEERLKLAREKLQLEKDKTGDGGDEETDNSFIDALKGKVGEAWDDGDKD